MEKLGQNLKMVRKWNNESQKSFGEKVGAAQTVVSDYEKGKRAPSLKVMERVAVVYKVSVDWLLGLSDEVFLVNK